MVDLLQRVAAALHDRYAVERELGRGGMAIVFLAHERKHDRPVALKVLRPDLAAALGPERFVREVQIAAGLTHSHILPLYDSGSADGFLYFTMPYVAGDSLRERLRRGGPMSVAEALTITRQIASALDHAHRSRLVHRDVKPENILLAAGTASGGDPPGDSGVTHALLTDFGIARAIDAAAEDEITAPGLAVGTPLYVSPEQAAGQRTIDGRSDVYSLGCVVFEMLAGVPPFTGPSATAIIGRKVTEPPAPLRSLNKAIPHAVDQAVARALSPDPANRFATTQEFVNALDGTVQRPWSLRQRRSTVAAIGAALFGATGWWTFAHLDAGPRSLAVIPCQSTVDDTARRFLGDVTEDLITEASRTRRFDKVIAFASTRRFSETAKSPREIGTELGADALLYCSYVQAGPREHLRAQLVRAEDGAQLWGENFERELMLVDDVPLPRLAMSRLARDVYGARGTVSPETRGSTTKNLRALNAYREGRYWLSRVDAPSIRKSIALFDEAIGLDSSFALPYLARARASFYLGIAHGDLDEQDAFTLSNADLETALRLDPDNADAIRRSAHGYQWGGDWTRVDRLIQRSLEIDPYLPNTYMTLAWQLSWRGRHREAFEASRRATELSPADPLVWANAGVYYTLAAEYDTALARARKSLDLAPNYHPAHWVIGSVYAELGKIDLAISHLSKAVSLSGHQIGFMGPLGYAYGLAGDTAAARAVARKLLDRARDGRTIGKTAAAIALVYIGLAHRDSAFHWMNVAADRRSFLFMTNFMMPPTWRVADDPRYDSLLTRIGLPGPLPAQRARRRSASLGDAIKR